MYCGFFFSALVIQPESFCVTVLHMNEELVTDLLLLICMHQLILTSSMPNPFTELFWKIKAIALSMGIWFECTSPLTSNFFWCSVYLHFNMHNPIFCPIYLGKIFSHFITESKYWALSLLDLPLILMGNYDFHILAPIDCKILMKMVICN